MTLAATVTGPVVADTNVLVYALDSAEPSRQELALATLATLAERGDWLLPVQVLAELASVALRKLSLPPDDIRELLLAQRQAAQRVLALTPATIDEALRGVREHGMSYYDAQIWAATRLAGGATLLSEDFQHGREVDGVRTLDPFRAP